MTSNSILSLIVGFTLLSRSIAADVKPRSATVVDIAGVETKVSGVSTSSEVHGKFGLYFDGHRVDDVLFVTAKNVEFLIPMESVSSVVASGQTEWTIRMHTQTGETNIVGRLKSGFYGSSDLGRMYVGIDKLKRLTFAEPGVPFKPSRIFGKYAPGLTNFVNAVITLTDGNKIGVERILRYGKNNYWDWQKLEVGLCSYHFSLQLGQTRHGIHFGKLQGIEFLDGNRVMVTTLSGEKRDMTIPEHVTYGEIGGFSGACSTGHVFVPRRFVKSISFEQRRETAP